MNFFILSSASLGFKFILILRASNTSAEPQFEETALLPCLATFTPKLAKTIAAAVEIFNEFCPSPPVPHVSTVFWSASTFVAFSLKTKIPPANSSLVSPFFERDSNISMIALSLYFPSISSLKRVLLSSNERFLPFFKISIKFVILISYKIFN